MRVGRKTIIKGGFNFEIMRVRWPDFATNKIQKKLRFSLGILGGLIMEKYQRVKLSSFSGSFKQI